MNNERMIHTCKYYIPQFTLVSVSSYIANSPLSLNGNGENWPLQKIPWHTIMLFVCHPKFCISIVFSFSWGHFNSQEKLKTMLMQNFGVTNKEHYGMLWYFWSGLLAKARRGWPINCHCNNFEATAVAGSPSKVFWYFPKTIFRFSSVDSR